MVEFLSGHKQDYDGLKAGSNQARTIDWFDKDGKLAPLALHDVDTADLWVLRHEVRSHFMRMLNEIDDELNDWTTIYCAICGVDDIAHRGQPFITWGIRGGHILCPGHLRAFDLRGTPEGERLKQEKQRIRQEKKEIEQLFG